MTRLSISGTVLRPYSLPRCPLLRSFLFVDSSAQLVFWLKKNNFLAFSKWNVLHRRKNLLYLPRRALKLFIKSFFMEKKPFYRNKAFWTLIASIIAALAAYFSVSCSISQKVFRHGIHCDTVRVESNVKTRDLSCLTTNPGIPSHSLSSSTLELGSSKHSLLFAPITPSTVATSLFGLPSQTVFESKPQLTPLSQLTCHFILPSNKSCSTLSVNELSMSSGFPTSSFSFTLASLVPIVPLGRSRRGGRKKVKPRPKVRTIIIGGRHL